MTGALEENQTGEKCGAGQGTLILNSVIRKGLHENIPFFFFLGSHLWHIEAPKLRVQWEL